MSEQRPRLDHENMIVYFGQTNFRNEMRKFGIKTDDRRRHVYVIGKTGMGKTTLLENMILADIYAGHGCCYVDPHGDTAEKLLDYIPAWRINDVVYFNPSDAEHPIGFNILEAIDPSMKNLVASALMSVFKKIWENVWSARMEYILNNTILALLDTPGTTMLGVNRMLSDKDYRLEIVKNIKDPIVKQFWVQEFAAYDAKFATEAVAPIQNKIGQFISSEVIRNIVAQANSSINLREIMDKGKIFIINLSKGRVGEDAMRLLGGMLITKMQVAAMERVNMPEKERRDFYLYVDEFQNFAVDSFASILSEARKYRLSLIMAHQYITQLSEPVRDAVFGNVGTIISFRVGSMDAEFLETEFAPRFTANDILNLPKYAIYLKLMIDGVASQPFSAATLPPIAQRTGSMQKVVEQSRERYGGNRQQIQDRVAIWSGFGPETDVVEKMAEVSKAKKEAKKERFMHEYTCSRCGTVFKLPIELDRSRPIYCEACKPIIDSERQKRAGKTGGAKGGGGGGAPKQGGGGGDRSRDRQTQPAVSRPPAVRDGELIAKPAGEKSASLADLGVGTRPAKESPKQPVSKSDKGSRPQEPRAPKASSGEHKKAESTVEEPALPAPTSSAKVAVLPNERITF